MKAILLIIVTLGLAACGPQGGKMLTVEDLQSEEDALNGELQDPVDDGDEDVLTPAPTPTPLPGESRVSFYLSSLKHQLAHDVAQFWEGCQTEQIVKGGYESDSVCSKAYVQPAFGVHLNRHFMTCVRTAATKAGIAAPARVFVRHWGSYNDRPARGSTRLSMHAYARAIDIVNFNLYDAKGTLKRISTHVRDYSGANAVFYDEFRACWKATIPSSCRSSDTESSGSIGFPGSKMGGNTLHNDHLHLSFPLCAG